MATTKAAAPPLPEFDHPHGWTWRNNMRCPSSIHVEPSFKPELGKVFVRIDMEGYGPRGIWLTREVMDDFITALRHAAAVPEFEEDDE